MFSGKDNKPHRVGAKEKREIARKLMRGGADADEIESRREGKSSDVAASVFAIYGMAVLLALLLTQGPLAEGSVSVKLPDPDLQRWLLGRSPPPVMGDPDMDMVIASLARGTAIFLLAAIVPLCTKLACLALKRDKVDLHAFWLASVVLFSAALAVAVIL